MGTVTQVKAAAAEESAASAEELSAQSESLRQIVKQLTALVTTEPWSEHQMASRN